ncbi:hypothetical protein QLQ15_06260 [Lysobacter sp. LF1]|uniref:30S ribosomal protein S3 n=1 Tax=Lysobacter stagni TaxID=3045172 RepID=A0ABT6XEE2_9GAMM|nr:hypothetical protein [Lysobacter sp. LF1]MDI9238515.1 hypothetical protein [Lysobacter sp. LF1]
MNTAYVIVVVSTVLVVGLHVGLYWKIRGWMDRDLALRLAGEDEARRTYMLARLAQARRDGVRRRDLPAWLERVAGEYRPG